MFFQQSSSQLACYGYHVSMPWPCSWITTVCPSFLHYLSLTPLSLDITKHHQAFLGDFNKEVISIIFFSTFFTFPFSHPIPCAVLCVGTWVRSLQTQRAAAESAAGLRGALLGRSACRPFSCMCLHTHLLVDVSFSLCCCFITSMILGWLVAFLSPMQDKNPCGGVENCRRLMKVLI